MRAESIIVACALVLASACGVDVIVGAGETAESMASASADGSEGDPNTSGATSGAESASTSTTAEATQTGDTSSSSGMAQPDVGAGGCDPLAQDCGPGAGCYFDGVGYTCLPEGEGADGQGCDGVGTCGPGLHCSAEGLCVPYCDPEDMAACAGGACVPLDGLDRAGTCGPPADCSGDPTTVEVQGECYLICDPLSQDCPDGNGCFEAPEADAFVCVIPGMAGSGEVCEFINACLPGLACVDGALLPGSPSPGGCTPFCDVTAPDCVAGLECTAVFAEGEEPPGYQDVGVCLEP